MSVSRVRIQKIIKRIGQKIGKYNLQSHSTGYQNVAELICLIDAEDSYKQMHSSFRRIHLESKEFLHDGPQFDSRRANKKLFAVRRLAATLAQYNCAHGVNVVIGENLQMVQNSDNGAKENTLTRLFSPKMIGDAIRMAHEKFGIAFIDSCDPAGTSKTDPLTGTLGHRDKTNKRKLFVRRNNEWVWIDSDLSASMNIMIRGLNRSVNPYKFYTAEGKNTRKRLSQFLKNQFGTDKVFFYEEQSGVVATVKKKEKPNGSARQTLALLSGRPLHHQHGTHGGAKAIGSHRLFDCSAT